MTRWAMVADLRRCVGCQTCTAACKQANATPPGVQWRRVVDLEVGEYPDVKRAFVPVGCMHCDDPPCMHVCPSTATRKRPDGIVTIDYDLCIGCGYCAVACPYQARFKGDKAAFAYGGPTESETQTFHPDQLGVATKCSFCVEPDIDLQMFQSVGVSDINYSNYKDPVLDELYIKQSRATDPEERKRHVRAFEKRLLDEEVHYIYTLQWHRIIPHSSKVRGWTITPAHFLNQQLDTVWLAE